ncbi:MAG TPA: hypothetical protein VF669_00865 [Tepidisphaeraceae bacterium]
MIRIPAHIGRLLRAPAADVSIPALWNDQSRAIALAPMLVRLFYVAMFYIQLEPHDMWANWVKLRTLRVVWPLGWFHLTGIPAGVMIVMLGALAASLLAASFPMRRICRILAALGMLQFGAFYNSFGAINHGPHAWIWVAVIFIFLPNGDPRTDPTSVARRQRYLRVFWSAQFAVLFFYSISGAIKLAAAAIQISQGQVHAFSPDALARHTAYNLQSDAFQSPFIIGPWLVRHPTVGWPFFLGAIYLETFSALAAFRPALHRLWAVAVIIMHLSIFFVMNILFSWQILLIAILILPSPFAPTATSLRTTLLALPLLRPLFNLLQAKRSADTLSLRPSSPLPVLRERAG